MAVRFLANAGRIIMSKAGYDASPSLPDQFKLFDSEWGASSMVVMLGTAFKQSGVNLIIPFPSPLHYAPAADVTKVGSGLNFDGGGARAQGYTTNAELVVTFAGWASENVNVRYIVWAVSI